MPRSLENEHDFILNPLDLIIVSLMSHLKN